MYSQVDLPLIKPETRFAELELEPLDAAVVNAKAEIRIELRSLGAGRFCTSAARLRQLNSASAKFAEEAISKRLL